MAALLVPDLAAAERVVQDAFASVHSAWPGYWHWQNAGATLCLLRRLVVDRSRAVPPGSRPGDSGLVSAVWALPARQREVLVLRYFADLPENQVAAATGISEAAVRSQAVLAFSTSAMLSAWAPTTRAISAATLRMSVSPAWGMMRVRKNTSGWAFISARMRSCAVMTSSGQAPNEP